METSVLIRVFARARPGSHRVTITTTHEAGGWPKLLRAAGNLGLRRVKVRGARE